MHVPGEIDGIIEFFSPKLPYFCTGYLTFSHFASFFWPEPLCVSCTRQKCVDSLSLKWIEK
jgi:hypothetical protein